MQFEIKDMLGNKQIYYINMKFTVNLASIFFVQLVLVVAESKRLAEANTTSVQENWWYICPLACYAYNYGGYHSFPRRDIWCKCPISIFALTRQQISELPAVTGEPPLFQTDMKTSLMRVLVSVFFFLEKEPLTHIFSKETLYF